MSQFSVWFAARKSYNTRCAVRVMAGVATLGDYASAIGARDLEGALVAELKAGSEEAYAWLIGEFHQPIYSLVYRILTDPADAADTTQEVFLKVFRGIKHFHGQSSLKTWIYRIAVHEASNRRRWWFRHKAKETSMEPLDNTSESGSVRAALIDERESPFDSAAHEEVRARVEMELRKVPEPYRSTVILARSGRHVVRRDRGSARNLTRDSEVPLDSRTGGVKAPAGRLRARGGSGTRVAESRRRRTAVYLRIANCERRT